MKDRRNDDDNATHAACMANSVKALVTYVSKKGTQALSKGTKKNKIVDQI